MDLKIFFSYSSKDLPVLDYIRTILAGSPVQVFVAEHSVAPGQALSSEIIAAIKQCDLFILLWSKNSKISEWVPQEIGVAKSENKQIIPVVLQSGLRLPGFISDLKYLDVEKDPERAFTWLRDNVFARADQKRKQEHIGAGLLALGGLFMLLASRK